MKLVDKQNVFFLIMFLGFLLGILYTNLFAAEYIKMTGVFSSYYLQEFLVKEVVIEDCFLQIMKVRLLPIIILIMMAHSKVNKIGVVAFLAWTGFLWGIFMSLGVTQLGFAGVFFCLSSVFPQVLFYIPAYVILLVFTYKYPSIESCGIKLCVVTLCIISGVVVECQICPFIIKWLITVI